jgi:hypothetical protein
MSQDYTKASFKKLLEKLQEESWQLELLISGFAIFGLFTAIEPLIQAGLEARAVDNPYSYITLQVILISCYILLCNLMLHVILRGLWIGALGLRYVSGDIDYETLNYSKRFDTYLRKKVGSFDKYIANLEDYCSVIFAISFLLIFYVLAFTLIILVISLTANYLIGNDELPGYISKGIGIPVILFLIFGMFLTFFDFITQGWLKKKQWISKIYFPIYWVFSFLTLSFLYRALVYNFLDHKFGKRLSFIIVPLYIVIAVGLSFNYKSSNYFKANNDSSDFYANNRNYEALIQDEKGIFIDRVAIPKKVITESFLKIFVVYHDNVEDNVFDFNEGLKPEKDIRGLRTNMQFNSGDAPKMNLDSLKREYIKTFNNVYVVTIDSTDYDKDFIFSQSKKSELGFETYVNIDNLDEGRHLLKVSRKRIRKNDTTLRSVAQIPFWYFRD